MGTARPEARRAPREADRSIPCTVTTSSQQIRFHDPKNRRVGPGCVATPAPALPGADTNISSGTLVDLSPLVLPKILQSEKPSSEPHCIARGEKATSAGADGRAV